MGKQQKKVRARKLPKIEKKPRVPDEVNKIGKQPFCWRVNYNYIDLDHQEWGWCKLSIKKFFDILVGRLHDYETMTWDELLKRPHCHPMPVSKIENNAQMRLSMICPDIDVLHQIDISGLCRIWGFKDRKFLYLIWHDPKHTVCLTKER